VGEVDHDVQDRRRRNQRDGDPDQRANPRQPATAAMSAWVHGVSFASAGFGAVVNTVPTSWSPQVAALVDTTCSDSVVTAPPAAF
jgi:hypothetical protein